jgi:hypothetical protein
MLNRDEEGLGNAATPSRQPSKCAYERWMKCRGTRLDSQVHDRLRVSEVVVVACHACHFQVHVYAHPTLAKRFLTYGNFVLVLAQCTIR